MTYRNPIKHPLIKLRLAIANFLWSFFKDFHTHNKEKARRLKQIRKIYDKGMVKKDIGRNGKPTKIMFIHRRG